MQKLKAILIDDEVLSLDVLEWELQGLDEPVHILGKYNDPFAGLEAIKSLKPDLVFLDIEMPRLNGIELLKKLGKIDFHIIFCTAYDQYAIEAIKHEALDYLLKPVSSDDLKHAMDKVRQRRGDGIEEKLLALYERLQAQSQDQKRIIIPTSEGLEFLEESEIVRCESESNYTSIFLADKRKVFVAKTLKDIQGMLNSEKFQRVHKSHVVNFDYIKRYLKADGGKIIMSNGDEIPISRSKKGEFFDHL